VINSRQVWIFSIRTRLSGPFTKTIPTEGNFDLAPVCRQFQVGGYTLGGSEFRTSHSPASIVQKTMPVSANIKDRDGGEGSVDCGTPRAEQLPLSRLGSRLGELEPDTVAATAITRLPTEDLTLPAMSIRRAV
jgi:hypothetical protein